MSEDNDVVIVCGIDCRILERMDDGSPVLIQLDRGQHPSPFDTNLHWFAARTDCDEGANLSVIEPLVVMCDGMPDRQEIDGLDGEWTVWAEPYQR